jgi:hypoxanthine phosphoribosyltransferase
MAEIKEFPKPSKVMTAKEGEKYFQSMLKQIKEFDPDEIVAVARSGFSYAQWIAQELDIKKLGVYYPDTKHLVSYGGKRLVFVDDNVLSGATYLEAKEFLSEKWPEIAMQWAVLFSDWHTPESVRKDIIQGTRLNYFAQEPVWGSRKISQEYGIRKRDE